MQSIVVVGASLAGLRAVEELRQGGFDGDIAVIGDEPHLPYDRPPLSKQVLAGDWSADQCALTVQADAGLEGLDVHWHLGSPAVGLDTWNRRVALANGEALSYDGLVLATGARPITLSRTTGRPVVPRRGRRAKPESPMAGVHTLRRLDDCLAIRESLDATPRRVVVVGGGFIGAEVAATCRQRGLAVTLVEALPVPLERAVGGQVGALLADVHRDHGVEVRLGVGVRRFEGGERVERVRLADGTTLEADLVVLGVGVVPNTEWLAGANLPLDNGVVCDASLQVAPGIVAAGDVARWPSARYGTSLRVEHWENAITMGEHAARTLLQRGSRGAGARRGGVPAPASAGPGGPTGPTGPTGIVPYDPVPWFWSDQYDRKIQMAGVVGEADEMVVVDGSLAERRFAAIYRRGDRIVGVVAMNRPRQVVTYRGLVARNATWEEALAMT